MPAFSVLPPTYYHAHFLEMLGFIGEVYAGVLGPEEHAFLKAFADLSPEAQCLFIRMTNRKRPVFTLKDLAYAEIPEPGLRLQELVARGFAQAATEDDYRGWLDTLTRPALETLARRHDPDVRRHWSKARLTQTVRTRMPFSDFAAAQPAPAFVPGYRETTGFLLYLYFGKLSDNLTAFTLRDMGVLSVRARTQHQARFVSREEARGGYAYSQALHAFKAADPETRLGLAEAADDLPDAVTPFVEGLRDRLMFDMGRFFEQRKDTPRALNFHARSGLFESQERTVRLLYAGGEIARAKTLLEAMLDAPAHDEAFLFADDFYQRKFGKKRTSPFTDLLRDADALVVDDLWRGLPELAAIRHYEAQSWRGFHLENGLWPALFGLLFWEEVFEHPGAVASDFDLWPQVLREDRFARDFPERIETVLSLVNEGRAHPLIARHAALYYGTPNALFEWQPGLEALICDFLACAPGSAVRDILAALCADFGSLRDGFPDLLLLGDGQVRFVEVKGDGDQIRRHQLARLNRLRQAGFKADIVRVTYRPDPDQVYVVVDIETTGGQSGLDRVTEIGAVKLHRGQVVDRWQSLIHPQRRIPSFITQLTGISNEMVADAPPFEAIAEDFSAFLHGAVFVAHNVNFDYGFLSAEYRRLGQGFRYPKLCTVAAMRKHFPGLPAYGLAPLSRHFGIELTSHHRALADATAAAELLKMVNDRRLAVTACGI